MPLPPCPPKSLFSPEPGPRLRLQLVANPLGPCASAALLRLAAGHVPGACKRPCVHGLRQVRSRPGVVGCRRPPPRLLALSAPPRAWPPRRRRRRAAPSVFALPLVGRPPVHGGSGLAFQARRGQRGACGHCARPRLPLLSREGSSRALVLLHSPFPPNPPGLVPALRARAHAHATTAHPAAKPCAAAGAPRPDPHSLPLIQPAAVRAGPLASPFSIFHFWRCGFPPRDGGPTPGHTAPEARCRPARPARAPRVGDDA
jgi:hypothetical protein